MSEYMFSASDNAFYASGELHLYEAAGSLPDDLVPVADEVFMKFAVNAVPLGMVRGVSEAGLPVWVEAPPLSDEVIGARNAAQREALMQLATERINPLQDAVDLDMATPAERTALTEWKTYRVALNRLSGAPGYPVTVVWPDQPA